MACRASLDAGRSPTSSSARSQQRDQHRRGSARRPGSRGCRPPADASSSPVSRSSSSCRVEHGRRRPAPARSPPRSSAVGSASAAACRRGAAPRARGSRMLTACSRSSSCVEQPAPLEQRSPAGAPGACAGCRAPRFSAARRAAAVERVDLRLEERRARRRGLRARVPSMSGARSASDVKRRAQRQQIAGEVAAVDGRDVGGRQRRERARVVPVVEVAAVALHPQQRVEGRLEPVERRRRS